MRSASISGWWYGSELTPVPSLMCFVRSAAIADEHLGRGDDLVAGGVVLADPRLVEAEPVQGHDQVEVALDGQRRVLPDGVERGHEDSEAHPPIVFRVAMSSLSFEVT